MHVKAPPSWKYTAKVLRIIDGDTMDFGLDLGFNLTHKIRVRVRNYDAPEIRNTDQFEIERAKAAIEMVGQLMPVDSTVLVTTYKDPGIYGRYEADITLADDRDFATVMKSLDLSKEPLPT